MGDELKGIFRFYERMGPKLLAEMTRQLLEDLTHYGIAPAGLALDWSDICFEGHTDLYLDGEIENYSGIGILDSEGKVIGDGWMDFVRESETTPLYIFWDYLSFNDIDLKEEFGIPPHVWERLPRPLQRQYKKIRMPE